MGVPAFSGGLLWPDPVRLFVVSGRVFRLSPVGCSGLILTGCSGFRPLAGWVACPAGSPMMSQSPRDEGFAPYRLNSFSPESSTAWRNGRLIPIQTEQLFPISGKCCSVFLRTEQHSFHRNEMKGECVLRGWNIAEFQIFGQWHFKERCSK